MKGDQTKFGRLTETARYRKNGRTYSQLRCECGGTIDIRRDRLTAGETTSCGCFHREDLIARNTVHGEAAEGSQTGEYRSWKAAVNRCFNKRGQNFRYYGGRGITMCDRWRNSYQNFLADMGRRPTAKHSIDRIDNDGNYEPGNCRWATKSQQSANRRPRKVSA